MVFRSRTQNKVTITGTREIYNFDNTAVISTFPSSISSIERCDDEVIVGNNGSLNIYKHEDFVPFIVNGTIQKPGQHKYTNFCPLGFTGLPTPTTSIPAVNGDQGNSVYATKLLRMTNPSRPYVDLPVFIAELKDIPDLLFKLGKPLKTVAQANLSIQFGWLPLLSDLGKMLNFQSVVDKRHKELKRLFSKGLRCTRELDTLSGEYSSNFDWFPTTGTRFRGQYKATAKCTVTGHVKWIPTSNGPSTDAAMLALARKAVFGLTVDFATAWELIPFSWLVDWFSNVGDFLMSQRNMIPCTHKDLLIMRETKRSGSVSFSDIQNPHALEVRGPSGSTVQKTRNTASASPSAQLEWLTPRQLSILGSFYVLNSRLRRY